MVREWALYGHFPRGKYHYKFIVNDRWILDPKNPEQETDADGNVNSVLNVKTVPVLEFDKPTRLFDYYHIVRKELDEVRSRLINC